ncbi:MAG TPA: TolC family protein [Pyrinomonadaceae bacterium]|nr:TolC family protein [Pyrinomonadaceae bacterium]
MKSFLKEWPRVGGGLLLAFFISSDLWSGVRAQSPSHPAAAQPGSGAGTTLVITETPESTTLRPSSLSPTLKLYYDPQGTSSSDLVRRALASNGELAAARIDIERARARMRQAGLRPNPTLDLEQTSGRYTGSAGESETSIGIALPLELGGKRKRRMELAQAELEAVEAEVADRKRRLAAEVRVNYAEALAALRELETAENLNNLAQQTTRFVQARVNEGETAPIELNLLMVEVDRLRSRRFLVEGRLKAALLRLKNLASIPFTEPLRLREDLATPVLPPPPGSLEAAIEIALRHRPDLRLAKLNEEVAHAGLSLARANSTPDVTAFSRYTLNRSSYQDSPVGVRNERDRLLTFGVSLGIPVFHRNQGAKAESAAAISQARTRREFLESVVRSEVESAYARYEAAREAVATFEQGVIARSNENIRVVRAAYELGHFSITDLLNEQRRLVDSQRDFTETLTEQYRALADLQTALGIPVN